jgi:DNA polymerase III subunit delta
MAKKESLASIFKLISSGPIKPVYAVVCNDSGLRTDLVARINRRILGDQEKPEGLICFGPEASAPFSLAQVMDEVRTPSLFTDKKHVLVRGAQTLIEGRSASPEAVEVLRAYVQAPLSGVTLLLEFEKLDGRSSFSKALKKSGSLLAPGPLYSTKFGESRMSMSSSMGAYLSQLARDRNLKLTTDAGCSLLELADDQAGFFAPQLEKLSLYLGSKRRQVQLEDVQRLASPGNAGVQPLVRAALTGKRASAISAAQKMFEQGMDHFGRLIVNENAISLAIINGLGRELKTVERTILNGGRCPPTRSGKNLPPHIAAPIERAARALTGSALERAYQLVLEADIAIKSSSGRSPRAIVETILVELIPSAGSRKDFCTS